MNEHIKGSSVQNSIDVEVHLKSDDCKLYKEGISENRKGTK